jgi:DNA-binding winged helix-turn-helix (wHTH) protein
LVGNRDRVVSKDDLLASVGAGGSFRVDARHGLMLRRIIGDSGEQQRLIRTTIGKGVRFVGAVQSGKPRPSGCFDPPRLSISCCLFNLSNDPG